MATIANLTSSTPESDRNLSTPQQLQMELLPDGPELSRLASAELRKLGFRVPKLKLTKTKSTKQVSGTTLFYRFPFNVPVGFEHYRS